MEIEHTAGPWVATRDEFAGQAGISLKGRDTEVNIIAFLWTKDVENEQEANARRIVACVNACDGIPTEALEQDSKRLLGGRLMEQNRELVEALVQAVEGAGFLVSGPTDSRAAEHGEPKWVCNARAVMANVQLLTVGKGTVGPDEGSSD